MNSVRINERWEPPFTLRVPLDEPAFLSRDEINALNLVCHYVALEHHLENWKWLPRPLETRIDQWINDIHPPRRGQRLTQKFKALETELSEAIVRETRLHMQLELKNVEFELNKSLVDKSYEFMYEAANKRLRNKYSRKLKNDDLKRWLTKALAEIPLRRERSELNAKQRHQNGTAAGGQPRRSPRQLIEPYDDRRRQPPTRRQYGQNENRRQDYPRDRRLPEPPRRQFETHFNDRRRDDHSGRQPDMPPLRQDDNSHDHWPRLPPRQQQGRRRDDQRDRQPVGQPQEPRQTEDRPSERTDRQQNQPPSRSNSQPSRQRFDSAAEGDWTVPKSTARTRNHTDPLNRSVATTANPFAPLCLNDDADNRRTTPTGSDNAAVTLTATPTNQSTTTAAATNESAATTATDRTTTGEVRRNTPVRTTPPPAPKTQRIQRHTRNAATTTDDNLPPSPTSDDLRWPSRTERQHRYIQDPRTFMPKVSRRRLQESQIQHAYTKSRILVIGDSNLRAWAHYPADWTVVAHSGYRVQEIAGLLERSADMLDNVEHVIVTAGVCNRDDAATDIEDAAHLLQRLQETLNGRLHFAGVPYADYISNQLKEKTISINDYMRDAVGADNYIEPPDPSTTVFFEDNTHYARRTGQQMISVVQTFLGDQ